MTQIDMAGVSPAMLGCDMASARPNDTTSEQQAEALATLRKLRNTVVHVTVSDPKDRKEVYAEFELSVSDTVVSALDTTMQGRRDLSGSEPNARLAAALEEAKHIKPRFKSAQELFDALEKEGRG